MSDNTDKGLLREIDEELRQEHYSKLWKRYGNYIIAAAFLLVLNVAGYKGWQSWDASRRNDASNQFAAAEALVERGNINQAIASFNALTKDAPDGYRILARFQSAGILARKGDSELAALAYQEISSDSSVQKEYRDLALLLAISNTLDTGSPEELNAQLAPLTIMNNPWRYSALEMSAILSLRSGDRMGAINTLKQLSSDSMTPAGISSRASEILASLNAQ